MQVCRIAVIYIYVDTVNWNRRCKLDLIVSLQGQLVGSCEQSNEHLVS
jgi:hypothetical protein